MTAYSTDAQRRHVNEALAALRSEGYGPERHDLERAYANLTDSQQRRSNAWQILVRKWVESR